jgi:hypothetical protein
MLEQTSGGPLSTRLCPSPDSLLVAAVAGLFGLAGCSGPTPSDRPGTDEQCPEPEPTGLGTGDTSSTTPTGPEILSSELNETINFAEFSQMCLERGGLMQTHATCAGNNACSGFHFNKFSKMFTEHTCKAINSCGGISCVILPEDAGRDAEQMYNETCGPACHGGTDIFKLWIHPARVVDDTPEALAAAQAAQLEHFQTMTMEYWLHMLAFGSRGMNSSGTAFADVAHRYDTHSRAELERIMDYVKTLPIEYQVFSILGETSDLQDPAEH